MLVVCEDDEDGDGMAKTGLSRSMGVSLAPGSTIIKLLSVLSAERRYPATLRTIFSSNVATMLRGTFPRGNRLELGFPGERVDVDWIEWEFERGGRSAEADDGILDCCCGCWGCEGWGGCVGGAHVSLCVAQSAFW